jgi:phage regulator Rha-like protein
LCENKRHHSLRHFIEHLLCIGKKNKQAHNLHNFHQEKIEERAGWVELNL